MLNFVCEVLFGVLPTCNLYVVPDFSYGWIMLSLAVSSVEADPLFQLSLQWLHCRLDTLNALSHKWP